MPLLILEVLNATLLAERNHVMWAAHWARFAASAPDSLTAVCPVEKRTTLCSANSTAMVSVVCLSSVTFVHPTQTVKLFGNIFSPYGSTIILDLPAVQHQTFSQNSDGVTPHGGAKYRWGIKISRFSTNKSLYLANDTKYRHSYYGR